MAIGLINEIREDIDRLICVLTAKMKEEEKSQSMLSKKKKRTLQGNDNRKGKEPESNKLLWCVRSGETLFCLDRVQIFCSTEIVPV
jgi:hypothetical protein